MKPGQEAERSDSLLVSTPVVVSSEPAENDRRGGGGGRRAVGRGGGTRPQHALRRLSHAAIDRQLPDRSRDRGPVATMGANLTYRSSFDSPLERAGFEPSVPNGSRSECESDQPECDGHVCDGFVVPCRDRGRVCRGWASTDPNLNLSPAPSRDKAISGSSDKFYHLITEPKASRAPLGRDEPGEAGGDRQNLPGRQNYPPLRPRVRRRLHTCSGRT